MNLVFDVGNTECKFGVFNGGEVELSGRVDEADLNSLAKELHHFSIKRCLISAVAEVPAGIFALIGEAPVLMLDENTPVPIRNDYKTPRSLGRDRLANACAAAWLFPGLPVLSIDAGTCLKFDFVDAQGAYLGGAISPGLRMRYKALHEGTAALPLLEPAVEFPLIGQDTASSIHSGVLNGMISEVEGICQQYKTKFADLQIIVTGGDHRFLLNRLKSSIFAAPSLTLQGLNVILEFQPI
jgi:type III pantothenate kinase